MIVEKDYSPGGMSLTSGALRTASACSTAQKTPHGDLLHKATVENAEFAVQIAARIERVADALTGSVPESSGSADSDPRAPDGFLDQMRSRAADQYRTLARISEALERLERDFNV